MRKSVDLLVTATALAVWGSTYLVTAEALADWHSLELAKLQATQRPSCLAFYTTGKPVDLRAPYLAT